MWLEREEIISIYLLFSGPRGPKVYPLYTHIRGSICGRRMQYLYHNELTPVVCVYGGRSTVTERCNSDNIAECGSAPRWVAHTCRRLLPACMRFVGMPRPNERLHRDKQRRDVGATLFLFDYQGTGSVAHRPFPHLTFPLEC